MEFLSYRRRDLSSLYRNFINEIISHLRETQIYRKKPASLVMRQVLIYCDFYIREIFMYAFIVELSAAIFEL